MRSHRSWLRLSSLVSSESTFLHSAPCCVPSCHSSSALQNGIQQRYILASIAVPFANILKHSPDPLALVKNEVRCVSERLRLGVTSELPALHQAAGYLFEGGTEGKRIRPSICLLLSSALATSPPSSEHTDHPDLRPVSVCPSEIRRRQQRVAEIAELIHVASLLHDDVIDGSDTRRGRKVLNLVVGNKVAILAGDFLLARASMTLASLENTAVVKLMSQILEDLVGGEIMQATASPDKLVSMDHYLAKTYHKTASLTANAAKATAVISGASPETCEVAFQYGRNIGLAFQVIDDVLDFTATGAILGKPALGDINAGVVTCPVLYAAEEHPSLLPLIRRKFSHVGDADYVVQCVANSQAIERSRALAQKFVTQAIECVNQLPASQSPQAELARQALLGVCATIVKRSK